MASKKMSAMSAKEFNKLEKALKKVIRKRIRGRIKLHLNVAALEDPDLRAYHKFLAVVLKEHGAELTRTIMIDLRRELVVAEIPDGE